MVAMATMATRSLVPPPNPAAGGVEATRRLGTTPRAAKGTSVVCKCRTRQGENESTCSRRETMAMLPLLATATVTATSAAGSAAAAAAAVAGVGSEEYTVAASGLEFCDTLVGSGAPPPKGTLIKAHYTGKLENGTVFDSSYSRGKPLSFRIGVGEVIKGWDQGILGADDIPPMLPGGKRKLRIPPSLGYGDRGAGCRAGSCVIPPKSVLLFDVEFLGKA